jgi:hypothetical protein
VGSGYIKHLKEPAVSMGKKNYLYNEPVVTKPVLLISENHGDQP